MARCFKVTVVTTGALKDATYGIIPNQYIDCEDSILYVIGEKPSDIEDIVDPTKIKKIEDIGVGYYLTE